MFSYLKPAVDSVQYVKTTFLNTFVKEENIREPLQEFVDKQAQFARDMLHVGDSLFNAFTSYDFSKLYKKAA